MDESTNKHKGVSNTAITTIHPIEHAEEYVKLVGDINPVHYYDSEAVQVYHLLTSRIHEKRKGDFLRGREDISYRREQKRLIQGMYTTQVSTLDLLPPELRGNVIGHTCLFSNPWLNSGDGEKIITNVSYKTTYSTKIDGRDTSVHIFSVSKSIREIPEWYIKSCFPFLSESSLQRKINEGEGIELVMLSYVYASDEPINFIPVNTRNEPYDRGTRITLDDEYFLKILLGDERMRTLPCVIEAGRRLEENRPTLKVLTDLLTDIVLEGKLEEVSPSLVVRNFDFGANDFEKYKQLLCLDPNAPLSFDYFEAMIPGVALEVASLKNLFNSAFMVYKSQNFKANGTLNLNPSSTLKKFSIIGFTPESKDKEYIFHCAIMVGNDLLGIGTTAGLLIEGEETSALRKILGDKIHGFFSRKK